MTTPKKAGNEIRKQASIFGEFLSALVELDLFVELSWSGLQVPKLYSTLRDRIAHVDPEFASTLDDGNPSAARRRDDLLRFATAQHDAGYPFLYLIGIVRLWTVLESMIEHAALEFVKKNPGAMQRDTLKSIEGPLVDFLGASDGERAAYLVDRLRDKVGARLKVGVGRFESILAPIGLGGAVPSSARRLILELSQIRNAAVHCNGRADKRLVASCPWLDVRIGDPIRVSEKQFRSYLEVVRFYMLELIYRWNHVPECRNDDELVWVTNQRDWWIKHLDELTGTGESS